VVLFDIIRQMDLIDHALFFTAGYIQGGFFFVPPDTSRMVSYCPAGYVQGGFFFCIAGYVPDGFFLSAAPLRERHCLDLKNGAK